ncbi:hypothetical protein TTHERM_00361340 (macronuclear) [Tetrahymena thermophila SB210]|uniref:Uncharacterized protein n=1 Tax=Tetrahymena thermophila (strain SB210) TaxID=312017 RepID=Q22PL0_TETTS|nr:hypothetical protein TTHERM_00361340 [Tetrahymena thermophila SB210]EAR87099.1 hypothetical protein TTHERM_00361340 [Tetrahymena thermophila SB210]|eukprot:XP_001007344.1 hypothetical protein TTHERM_00361340 [Tetrahymena thermophila SB210]
MRRQYSYTYQIKISEKNINQIQITLDNNKYGCTETFKKILELSKISPSLQIISLVIDYQIFPYCLNQLFQQLKRRKYENKSVEKDKLQELFLKYQSLFIQEFLEDLKVYSIEEKFGQITENIFDEQNQSDQILKSKLLKGWFHKHQKSF